MASDLERLLRWERAGGRWRVISQREDSVVLALVSCGGDEEMERLRSGDPELIAHLGARQGSDEPLLRE